MRPFHFPLQSIRNLRNHKEQQVREHYAKTLRECEDAASRVQTASVELAGGWATLTDKLNAGVTGTDLLRARAWCNVLELRLKESATALEHARHQVDAVWQELLIATRERETLDKFHEKRLRAYNRDLEREQQKTLDEMAIQLMRLPQPLRPAARAASPA